MRKKPEVIIMKTMYRNLTPEERSSLRKFFPGQSVADVIRRGAVIDQACRESRYPSVVAVDAPLLPESEFAVALFAKYGAR
ncbi:MAG: hypothetical protein HYY37_06250 [Candidatus Aenigmarchaeota archaeon]|nr:hypothetical protein [Candidatus Aenigmarchaeota archaeon]